MKWARAWHRGRAWGVLAVALCGPAAAETGAKANQARAPHRTRLAVNLAFPTYEVLVRHHAELDAALQAGGAGPLSHQDALLGLQFAFALEGFRFQGRMSGVLTDGGAVEPRPSEQRFDFDLGYHLIDHHPFLLYPLVGVNYTRLHLEQEGATPVLMAEHVPSVHHELSRDLYALKVALGWETVVFANATESPTPQTTAGFLLGMEMGLLRQFAQSDWSVDAGSGDQLPGEPDADGSGYFFLLKLGIGLRAFENAD